MRRAVLFAGVVARALVAAPALASGNAHVIDDAGVETPGSCHLESWISGFGKGDGLLNLAPACTRKAWPRLELGGFLTRTHSPAATETAIGVAPKWTIWSDAGGRGVALSTSAGYSLSRHRIENAALIVPLTIPITDQLRVNINAGGQWFRSAGRVDAFGGAQAEYRLRAGLTLMAEAFGRDRAKPGGQFGLRWTSRGGDGRFDLDLIAGRRVDGVHRSALTLGMTFRR